MNLLSRVHSLFTNTGKNETSDDTMRKKRKKNWEITFDAIDDWICIIDVNSKILRSNKTVEKYFNVPVQKSIGMTCCEFLHGTQEPIDGCPVPKMLKSKKRESVEIKTKDGRWMMITVDPILNADNVPVSIVHIARDITQRIKEQYEREKLLNDLKEASSRIKTLTGLIPICSICKKIRDDKGYWNLLESYIEQHSNAAFSHGMCPECADKMYEKEDWYVKMKKGKQ